MRLAQPVHGVGGLEGGLLVDANEGTLAFTGRVGDPGEALLDQFSSGGRAAVEISGQCGKCRRIGHDAWLLSLLILARRGRDIEIEQR